VACREWLARFGQEGATILVKGSRFMTMELVIRALQDGDRNAPQAGGNH
jgi:UDP-N-acetylmuramyl pentapeptide synthase